jgi:hypothetical protein
VAAVKAHVVVHNNYAHKINNKIECLFVRMLY